MATSKKAKSKPRSAKPAGAKSLGPQLISAASKGNVAETKRLLAQGADPGWSHPYVWDKYDKVNDPDDPAFDPDARPLNAGWTALHHAAHGKHYEVVRLLCEHSPAAVKIEDAKEERPYDVTPDERCILLMRACAEGDTVASYEARRGRTSQATAAAKATGAFHVGVMKEGTNISERPAYALEKTLEMYVARESARATPAGYVLVYRGSVRKAGFRVSIEGKRGVKKFVTKVKTHNSTNAASRDGQRFLVVDGAGGLHQIDGRERTDRVIAKIDGEVQDVGFLRGGVFAFANGKLHAFADDGKRWWSLAIEAFHVFATNTSVVAITPPPASRPRRIVLATATVDGLRILGRIERDLDWVWAYESGVYLLSNSAAPLELQNPDAAKAEGEVVKAWPGPPALAKLPLFETP